MLIRQNNRVTHEESPAQNLGYILKSYPKKSPPTFYIHFQQTKLLHIWVKHFERLGGNSQISGFWKNPTKNSHPPEKIKYKTLTHNQMPEMVYQYLHYTCIFPFVFVPFHYRLPLRYLTPPLLSRLDQSCTYCVVLFW